MESSGNPKRPSSLYLAIQGSSAHVLTSTSCSFGLISCTATAMSGVHEGQGRAALHRDERVDNQRCRASLFPVELIDGVPWPQAVALRCQRVGAAVVSMAVTLTHCFSNDFETPTQHCFW